MARLVALTGVLVLAAMVLAAGSAEAGQVARAKSLTKAEILADGGEVIKNDCRKLGHRNKKGVRCKWFSAALVGTTTTRNCKGSSELKKGAARVRFKTSGCRTDKGASSLNSLMPAKLLKAGYDSTSVFCFTTLGRGFECSWKALRHSPSSIDDCNGKARSFNGRSKIGLLGCTRNPAATATQAAVKGLLASKDLTPGLVSCRPGELIECTYEASRRSAGWTYSCTGTTTAATEAGPFKLSECDLDAPELAPVTSNLGPHPAFGINESWAPMLGELDHLQRDFGAETARLHISWSHVQRHEGGPYDFDYFDTIYARMQANGIDPVIMIWSSPCWATGDSTCSSTDYGYAPDAQHLDEWGGFAAAVALRYPEAMGIEIWNEANARFFFHGGPQPGRYAALLKQAYISIKAVDPGMPVITNGTAAFASTNRDQMRYDDFLRKVYEALGPGAAGYSDAIGHHVYPGGGPAADIESGVRRQIAALKDVMLDFGDQDKPIWITESGVSTTGRDPYTEAQQASAFVKIYKQFRRIPGVPVVIMHRWRDAPGPVIEFEGFGLQRADGSKKPVYCTLAAARGRQLPDSACR